LAKKKWFTEKCFVRMSVAAHSNDVGLGAKRTSTSVGDAIVGARLIAWIKGNIRLRPDRWSFDRHAVGARHQIELERDQLRRAIIVSLRADAGNAAAQAAFQRAERLPLQPVLGIAGRMSLRDCRSGKALVPVVVVAIGAGEVELALSQHE